MSSEELLLGTVKAPLFCVSEMFSEAWLAPQPSAGTVHVGCGKPRCLASGSRKWGGSSMSFQMQSPEAENWSTITQ